MCDCSGGRENGKVAKAKPKTKPECVIGTCSLTTQDPVIKPIASPKDMGCGGNEWKVWFELPKPATQDGWIIQEVKYTIEKDAPSKSKKTYHFWEAWKVEKGKKVTVWQDKKLDDNDDLYRDPPSPGTKGTYTTVGKAKFFEGKLPPDFKQNNEETLASILHSTVNKPPFWDGTGTDHNLTSSWDCTPGSESKASEITTEP